MSDSTTRIYEVIGREGTGSHKISEGFNEETVLQKTFVEKGPMDHSEKCYDAARDLLESMNLMHCMCQEKSVWYPEVNGLQKVKIVLWSCLKSLVSWINIPIALLVYTMKKSSRGLPVLGSNVRRSADIFDIEVYEHFTAIWPSEEVDELGKAEYKRRLKIINDSTRIGSKSKLRIFLKELHEVCYESHAERIKVFLDVVNFKGNKELVDGIGELLYACVLSGFSRAAIEIIKATGDYFILALESDGSVRGSALVHLSIMDANCELLHLILDKVQKDKMYEFLNKEYEPESGSLQSAQLPLNMAVWMGNVGGAKSLVEHGAEMDGRDENGFGVFHFLVLLEPHAPEIVEEMFDCLVEIVGVWIEKTRSMAYLRAMERDQALLYAQWTLMRTNDKNNLSPLQFSAKMGSLGVFRKLMQVNHVYHFPYLCLGPFTQHYYDISEIDPFLMSQYPTSSVIEIVGLAPTAKNLAFLDEPPVFQVVRHLWSYTQPMVAIWGLLHTISMTFLSVEVYQTIARDLDRFPSDTYELTFFDYVSIGHTWWYGLLTSATTWTIFSMTWRVEKSLRRCVGNIDILQTYLLLIYTACLVAYVIGIHFRTEWRTWCLVGFLLFGWCLTFLFFRAFKPLRLFTIMLSHMLEGDAKIYTGVMVMLSVAFAISIRPMHTIITNKTPNSTVSFLADTMSFFRLGMGVSDFTKLVSSGLEKEDAAILFVYVFFIFLANLTILNMLIASMSESYSQMSGQRILQFRKMVTNDAIVLHQLLPDYIRKLLACAHVHKVLRFDLPDGTKAEKHVYLVVTPAVITDTTL